MTEPLKVWFLASEMAPFAKTGGLADVAGSLPASLKNLGVDIRVGLPFYRTVKDGSFEIKKSLDGLEVQRALGQRGVRVDEDVQADPDVLGQDQHDEQQQRQARQPDGHGRPVSAEPIDCSRRTVLRD